ncbi:claudin-3 [Rhinopithecus roxellana]|nr:claudin-3 [Rhinopithecus roxellana]
MSMGLEITGTALAVLGWLGTIVCCALPMWRVTAFIGSNIITSQTIWEGLWMNCVVQSTGQMQCKVYDSLLALPQDLQAARALIVVAILLAAFGLLVALVGAQCTNCVQDDTAKAKITIVAGVLFLLAALLTLVPVSWSANTIIREFYNPVVPEAQKREMGTSLYMGWAAAALQLLGGALLCCSCPPREKKYMPTKVVYSAPRSTGPGASMGTAYDRKDYVKGTDAGRLPTFTTASWSAHQAIQHAALPWRPAHSQMPGSSRAGLGGGCSRTPPQQPPLFRPGSRLQGPGTNLHGL